MKPVEGAAAAQDSAPDVPFCADLVTAAVVVMARRSVRTLCSGETQAICGAIHGARATAGPVLV